MHYLDHSATSPVLPEAAQEALRLMTEQFGNPSSVHRLGIAAADELSRARKQLAQLTGCTAEELTFTA